MKIILWLCLSIVTLAIWVDPILSQTQADVRVPFVGCESSGQLGTFDVPKGTEKAVQIMASAAPRLTYYKAETSAGVLAPRGWHCLGVNGSSGNDFLVTPQPLNENGPFYSIRDKITGPAIQVREICSDNSGRIDIARVIARAFPKQKAFVDKILQNPDFPASDFPFGPYPKDKLIRRNDWIVEYQTPPDSEGLGTINELPKGNLPISGVAILRDHSPDCLLFLAIRLPSEMTNLIPQIIQQVTRENGEKAKP
jgi:hypothetical protein